MAVYELIWDIKALVFGLRLTNDICYITLSLGSVIVNSNTRKDRYNINDYNIMHR